MHAVRTLVALGISSVAWASAQGPFVWLDVRGEGGTQQACVYFSEHPAARNAHLIGKVRHDTTLSMRLPAGAAPAPAAAKAAADPAAEATLAKARKARAIWRDFPGMRAKITVRIDGQAADGRAVVDSSGVVTLDMPDSPLKDWAERQLESLVQHRMPANDPDEHVTFVEEPNSHPLGRKLRLGDAKMDSHYRVRDDVITEVNRKMGEARMTISVLEVYRNAAGKYLPRIFAVNLWDEKGGALRSTTVASNEWKAVGKFDLPARVFEVYSANNKSQTRELLLNDVELLDAKR